MITRKEIMPNWSYFEKLSGSTENNFERLCREIVKRQFSSDGRFEELNNEPGIEFSITLDRDNNRIGKAGEQVGWQCKWFQYNQNGSLSESHKKQIKHSLEETVKYHKKLKSWILWTHKELVKSDAAWFKELQRNYTFKLENWNQKDIDGLMTGNATDLEYCFFGKLALTPEMLAEQHEISVAPISYRWIHAVHVQTDCEKEIKMILGEGPSWSVLPETGQKLSDIVNHIQKEAEDSAYETVKNTIVQFTDCCRQFITWSNAFPEGFSANCIDEIRDTTTKAKNTQLGFAWELLRELRCRNMMFSLSVTNALACILRIQKTFELLLHQISEQFIAVVADAGAGKTQFAAELTAPGAKRPAGILLLGRYLEKGNTLDTLSSRIQFYNEPVKTFRNLLCAVDMAGVRCNCRLPIVIDGLNEAENPRKWKDLLAEILPILKDYPNVVLVCTLRTGERAKSPEYVSFDTTGNRDSFVKMALPDNCHILYSEGFTEQDLRKVVPLYFNYYKIKADLAVFETGFFSHPLTLRIFCEVTNQKREKQVEILSFPSSVYGMFGEFVERTAKTISNMPNLSVHYTEKDIQDAVYFLGGALWDDGKRSAPEDKFRSLYNRQPCDWESDIVNLLVQEGLLFRDEEERYVYRLSPAYDMLGGYFAANYLLEKHKNDNLSDWINTPEYTEKLFGENEKRHQLAEDILKALVALTPVKFYSKQLWNAVDDKYKPEVIALSPLIDPAYISQDIVDEFRTFIVQNRMPYDVFRELLKFSYCSKHPFNVDFFSSVMKLLSVQERDLSWTEYVRRDFLQSAVPAETKKGIQKIQSYWKADEWNNSEQERMHAVYFAWFLTTTCPELRYAATEALFDYGLHDPEKLFTITLSLLDVNDPYIPERLLAVCYGVAGTIIQGKVQYRDRIVDFAKHLQKRMFSKEADAATTHLLTREYASALIQTVNHIVPGVFTEEEIVSARIPFPNMPRKKWKRASMGNVHEYENSPFHMDFENYTIGRLVKNRQNYDYDNKEYRDIREKIYWRVLDIGWDSEKYKSVEKSIEQDVRTMKDIWPLTERYGKKYSWIAYYEMAGMLDDNGKLERYEKGFGRNIDPFFPITTTDTIKKDFFFIGNSSISTSEWIASTDIPDITNAIQQVLPAEELDNWMLLYADVVEDSEEQDQRVMFGVTKYFMPQEEAEAFTKQIDGKKEIVWPKHDSTNDIYTGEIYSASECKNIGQQIIEVLKYKQKRLENIPSVKIDDGTISLTAKQQVIETPVYHAIKCFQPVLTYTFGFEGGKDSLYSPLLSPWIFKDLVLRFNPHTLTYTDCNNEKAVFCSVMTDDKYRNTKIMVFLRKDLYEKLVAVKNFRCITRTDGEKSNSYFSKKRRSSDKMEYKNFEEIK